MMNTFDDVSIRERFKGRPDRPIDIGLVIGSSLSFLIGWTGLLCLPPSQHWIAGFVGAGVGGLFGWGWVRFKTRKNHDIQTE